MDQILRLQGNYRLEAEQYRIDISEVKLEIWKTNRMGGGILKQLQKTRTKDKQTNNKYYTNKNQAVSKYTIKLSWSKERLVQTEMVVLPKL